MNPLKKLLSQTAVYGLSSIIGRTLTYFLVPLYTYKFGQEGIAEYGVVSQLYAFVAFLMVLLTFGMETSYFRFLQDEDDKKQVFRNSFLTIVFLNVLFLVSVILFNQDIADLLLMPAHPEYIVFLSIIVTIDSVTSLPLAKLRAEDRAKRFAVVQFTSIGVNVLLNLILIGLFFDNSHPEEGVLFILLANILSSLVKPLMLYKDFKDLKFVIDWYLFRRMLKYAFPIVLAGFAGIVNETIDRIMLKQMLYDPANGFTARMADTQIGIYSACYKLAMLVTILLQAYRYAAEPFFFNQMKNQDRNKLYVKLMNYFVAIVCLIFLGVSLNLDIFKYFITNEAYWEGLGVVPILLLANVFLGIYLNQSIWYKLSNQTKYGAYISIIGAVITIAINYIFIPKYGYLASAWATLIVYALQMSISYVWGQKHFPIPYNLRKFSLYLFSSILFYWIATRFEFESNVTAFFFHNFWIVLYIGLVYFIEVGSKKKPQVV